MGSKCDTRSHPGNMACAATSSHFAVPSHQLDAILNPRLPTQTLAQEGALAAPTAARPVKTSRLKPSIGRHINDALAKGADRAH